MDDLEARHRALIERDRWIGLEAEAASARDHAARLEHRLAVAQERLDRKNARIEHLAARVRDLEDAPSDGERGRLWRRRGPAS